MIVLGSMSVIVGARFLVAARVFVAVLIAYVLGALLLVPVRMIMAVRSLRPKPKLKDVQAAL